MCSEPLGSWSNAWAAQRRDRRSGRGPRRAARPDPDETPGSVGDDLDVHAMASLLSGVVRLLVGDAVDRDRRTVQDRVGQPPYAFHGGVQVFCSRAEQDDHLLDVAPGGGDPDLEAGGEAGIGVAVAQVGRGEQGLGPAASTVAGGIGSATYEIGRPVVTAGSAGNCQVDRAASCALRDQVARLDLPARIRPKKVSHYFAVPVVAFVSCED